MQLREVSIMAGVILYTLNLSVSLIGKRYSTKENEILVKKIDKPRPLSVF